MATPALHKQIARKGADQDRIAGRVIEKPELIEDLVAGLEADTPGVRYGCAKILRLVSERAPEILYDRFDLLTSLLDNDNSFIKWDAIYIIGNLAAVDERRRFDKIFKKYFAPIPGPVLITAANVIGAAAGIARSRPDLTARITREILMVEKARYKTAECRNVALGQAIQAFDGFFDQIRNKKPVLELVRRQVRNRRPATKKKAEKFLKKHGG